MTTTEITIDCTQTVNEIVARYPGTLPVFTAWGIDTCCGGKHAVEEVVRRHGIDGAALCDALAVAIAAR